jgi:hypothetical protein
MRAPLVSSPYMASYGKKQEAVKNPEIQACGVCRSSWGSSVSFRR